MGLGLVCWLTWYQWSRRRLLMMSPWCPKEGLAEAGLGVMRTAPSREQGGSARDTVGAEAGEARVAMSGLGRLFGRGEPGRGWSPGGAGCSGLEAGRAGDAV